MTLGHDQGGGSRGVGTPVKFGGVVNSLLPFFQGYLNFENPTPHLTAGISTADFCLHLFSESALFVCSMQPVD